MPHYTIIGAGITGLTVAERLLDHGHTVTILERYGKVGGRIATHRNTTTGIQYEMGAGRIHASHKKVHALIRRFRLRTYPINDTVVYRPLATRGEEPVGHEWIFPAILKMLEGLPAKTLGRHTIAELLTPEWRVLLSRFPYWAEVHMLRADLAIEAFRAEMGTYGGYVGIVEGIDAITAGLRDAVAAKGGEIRVRHRVEDVQRRSSGEYEIVGNYGKKAEARPFTLVADRLIIATCRCSLGTFSVLKGHPVLQQLQTSPLLRIYAQYPHSGGRSWFSNIPKTITDSPLRFVIPIDPTKGVIMISYTDGDDTKAWMSKEGTGLSKAVQKEVRRLFGENVPDPISMEKYPWPGGCTYWTPGAYDVDKAIKAAMYPAKDLWIVGESVARHQAWIESALDAADILLKILK